MLQPAILAASLALADPADLPVVDVSRDNTVITQSCRIHISPGTVIPDQDANGVIHVSGLNIRIIFEPGSVLRGAPASTPPDQMTGIGIAASGATGLSISNAAVSGFKRGIFIQDTRDATLDNCTFSDNFRHRLRSTPDAEDPSDWLWPHDNTDSKWATQYGAAIHALHCGNLTISNCTVRKGQNGIILDHVNDSRVFDNDASFLSGWGLALWHASRNSIHRNALDFCIRGYSHNVYNRGQDSAGILVFEQCTHNTFAFNSATHSGDGFFAFSGKSALGESDALKPASYVRAGNSRTLLYGNDFSYAAAHGIETTFSFDFDIAENRLVANAICGIWGGYSQSMLITRNTLADNGQAGYGLERGGINIEHGAGNRIIDNRFTSNACGVHLWSDLDAGIAKTPWYAANHKGSTDNLIARNSFDRDATAIQLRQSDRTRILENTFNAVGAEILDDAPDANRQPDDNPPVQTPDVPRPQTLVGVRTPVGARAHLQGRENIVMGEWEPWDHQSPMVRLLSRKNAVDLYEVLAPPADLTWTIQNASHQQVTIQQEPAARPGAIVLRVTPRHDVASYTLDVTGEGLDFTTTNTIVAAKWNVRVFPWKTDPRENLEAWRAESNAPEARSATLEALTLRYANSGPKSLKGVSAFKDAPIGSDRFGTIATTTLTLPKGRWKLSTLSDDGVRVIVNGTPLIENWTWHAPTRDTAEFQTSGEDQTTITVEHFELDGYATLELSITPA